MDNKLKIFENKQIRTLWNADEEDWYFSVVDVISVLTDSSNPRKYWSVLKKRLKTEGSELTTICSQLKMQSADGKYYKTDCLNTKGVLRLIQSIPSPKAEPFKVWLAKVGAERLDEIADPEKAIARGVGYYRKKGYPQDWINQRMLSVTVRNELTDEWNSRGITESKEYAILTNEMTKAWSGLSVKEYKEFKNLKKESLRDNMTDLELILNMLAEATTTNLSKQTDPQTFDESRSVAKAGGETAKQARKAVEKTLGHSVISSANAENKAALEAKKELPPKQR